MIIYYHNLFLIDYDDIWLNYYIKKIQNKVRETILP